MESNRSSVSDDDDDDDDAKAHHHRIENLKFGEILFFFPSLKTRKN